MRTLGGGVVGMHNISIILPLSQLADSSPARGAFGGRFGSRPYGWIWGAVCPLSQKSEIFDSSPRGRAENTHLRCDPRDDRLLLGYGVRPFPAIGYDRNEGGAGGAKTK